VNFKREVYVRALHHLAPFARTVAGSDAIPTPARPPVVAVFRDATVRRRMP
jgi:hypothetical protein